MQGKGAFAVLATHLHGNKVILCALLKDLYSYFANNFRIKNASMIVTSVIKMSKAASLTLTVACIALMFGFAACNKNQPSDNGAESQPAQQTDQSQLNQSPGQPDNPISASNLAPASDTQATENNYQQEPSDSGNDYDADSQDASYGQPELQASDPPPPLPEYSQPECPGDGYLWTPGYWSYAPQGYYWVPGAWARPPEVGFLWTPGYWGFVSGRYRYHYGFWGRHIGYYGGINYGFGYVGIGYQGGYWHGNRFDYNRSVNNVNVSNVEVYNRTVTNTVIVNNTTINITNNRYSYAGPGGVSRRPLPTEIAAAREQRIPPMNTQLQQRQAAAQNHQQFASVNKGRPAILAAAKPIPQGKPIAPVIPAHPALTTRPASPNAEANRPSPSAATPAARPAQPNPEPNRPKPAGAPARASAPSPARPAEPMRKTGETPRPGAERASPAARTKPEAPPVERRTQPAAAAHPQPAVRQEPRPATPAPSPVPNRPAPKPENRPTAQSPKAAERPAPAAKPKTEPPADKKEPPKEKQKPD